MYVQIFTSAGLWLRFRFKLSTLMEPVCQRLGLTLAPFDHVERTIPRKRDWMPNVNGLAGREKSFSSSFFPSPPLELSQTCFQGSLL